MEKQCFKCGEVKPLSDFYRHPRMKDGHVNKCKNCNKKDVRENYKLKIDYYKEYNSNRAMLPHRVEARKEYIQTEVGKRSILKSKQKWTQNNPIKRQATYKVNNAVRDGILIKPETCSECGSGGRIHGHHCDYSKPLDVIWLCPSCHTRWHKLNGEAKNG
jgi:hypothetical protein